MSSFFITTLGCHKNKADSREMHRSMRSAGFFPVSDVQKAHYHIVNSCAFIESAREETIQVVLESAQIKKKNEQKLVLVGCFSQRYQDAVSKDLPEVDFLFGTGRYDQAGALLCEKFGPPSLHAQENQNDLLDLDSNEGIWAPVKISEGCNRSCAFCAIPQMRGKFQSLGHEKIIQEVESLVKEGIREVCLVSQDTNQYGTGTDGFVRLVEQLNGILDLEWIRLLYMYPDKRTLSIYKELAEHKFNKFVPYIESPVQHVSPRVLKAMRRYVDPTGFVDFFAEIRDLFPGIEIRTSFLCGFPGEQTSDVDALLEFIEKVKPEKLALFSYSREPGTLGYDLGETVSFEQKSERILLLRNAHLEILKQYHKQRVGRVYECIVDKIETDKTMVVRRPQDAPEIDELVFVETDSTRAFKLGALVNIKINGFYEYDMTGEMV